MDLIVFNVDHGLCVFVRTPSGHGIMIDVGCSDSFKPTEWLSEPSNIVIRLHERKRLTYLVVTHPHDDHVEGIASLKKFFLPAILVRHKNYDWQAVLAPPDSDPSKNAKEYYEWQHGYSTPATNLPDLGCTFERFALSPQEAKAAGGSMQNWLNNSSYVSVLSWQEQGGYPWKVVICGDNESNGLDLLLQKAKFREAISGATVLVTPHHGHSSGYNAEFMRALGQPKLCISSLPAKDQHFDPNYASWCTGLEFNGENRSHLTTRSNGHIWLEMNASTYNFRSVVKNAEVMKAIFEALK